MEKAGESKGTTCAGNSDGDDASGPRGPGGLRRLAAELHWSFVVGVVAVYGACQGVGAAVAGVAVDYYWKDVQRVEPSASQFFQSFGAAPWLVKPLWGLLTDVVPVRGYRRRPYFVLAGILGVTSTLTLSLQKRTQALTAVMLLVIQSAGAAIADVTIDAVVAQNSTKHPALASDMQSLCGFSQSLGSLLGFSMSGLLVRAMGSQGVLGLLSIPSALVFSAGVLLKENNVPDFSYKKVHLKFLEATHKMWRAMRCPEIWRPCTYLFLSLALSLDMQEGIFYWLTEPISGLSFSEETIGLVYSVGAVGALIGVFLYQNVMKDYRFRSILLWGQILGSLAGMLDLVMVLRINLKIGIPDYFFAVGDSLVSETIANLKWMPLLVLCAKICPPGVEGTFFALLMSIGNAGTLISSGIGSLLLRALNISRSDFHSLWIAVLARSISRLAPLLFLFLVPDIDQNSSVLPEHMIRECNDADTQNAEAVHTDELSSGAVHARFDEIELIPLVSKG